MNFLILFASPLDLSSQTHSLGLWLIVDSAGTLPYCSHSIHLWAFALAHPGADSVSSLCYDSHWHPESLPASIVAISCCRFLSSHPFFGFGRHRLIRHASNEQRTIVFLPPYQKPHLCRFTAVSQFWFDPLRQPPRFGPMHEYRPIFLSSIWKRQQVASSNYPCTPTFDAYVSCNYSQAFPSSLPSAQVPRPKCKEDQQPLYFCLSQE